jgi:hypothetical protein
MDKQKEMKCISSRILEICIEWGMSNPNDIRHWMDDIDKEINRQVNEPNREKRLEPK